MTENPPKCFLGCYNVRSWTLAVSIIYIVIHIILVLRAIPSIKTSPGSALLSIIVRIFLGYVDFKLRKGVKEHDIAPIRLWLRVYLVWTIFETLFMITFTLLLSSGDLQNTKFRFLKPYVSLVELCFIILEGFEVLNYYSVYQFYIFEKTRLQSIGISRRPQTA